MTRVNLGVEPSELCDQHLIAELRELPRVFAYSADRPVLGPFRLGTGHVLWCAQYPGTMAARYRQLVAEMRVRGFVVRYPEPRGDGRLVSPGMVSAARATVMGRLLERLESMASDPRWTRRSPPAWTHPSLSRRTTAVTWYQDGLYTHCGWACGVMVASAVVRVSTPTRYVWRAYGAPGPVVATGWASSAGEAMAAAEAAHWAHLAEGLGGLL